METTGSIKHNKGVSKKGSTKNKFFESAKSKNEEKAVLGTAYFSALFSGCILILKSTGSPVCFIVLHNLLEICIAKCKINVLQIKEGCITLKEIQQKKEENETFIALLS